jgi:hypothetical protein
VHGGAGERGRAGGEHHEPRRIGAKCRYCRDEQDLMQQLPGSGIFTQLPVPGIGEGLDSWEIFFVLIGVSCIGQKLYCIRQGVN